jgi:hypothetical protein
MLLTIEGRSPLFVDKRETTMTTTRSILAFAVAFAATTLLAGGSASARTALQARPLVTTAHFGGTGVPDYGGYRGYYGGYRGYYGGYGSPRGRR